MDLETRGVPLNSIESHHDELPSTEERRIRTLKTGRSPVTQQDQDQEASLQNALQDLQRIISQSATLTLINSWIANHSFQNKKSPRYSATMGLGQHPTQLSHRPKMTSFCGIPSLDLSHTERLNMNQGHQIHKDSNTSRMTARMSIVKARLPK